MKFHGLRPDGAVTSENWSGYAVTGSSFTQALGSWIVPTVACNVTPNGYSAFWVGLDGYSSSTVEQIGTDSDCNGGTPSYYAWYEFYPKFPVINILAVNPGDKISAEVGYNGKEFTLTITNERTLKSYSTSGRVPQAKRSSAEWIAEASGGAPSDFGTASFGSDYTSVVPITNTATGSSTSGPIGAFAQQNVQRITMVSSNDVPEAIPSNLTTDGLSFMICVPPLACNSQ
jgi:hypothetical protein